MLGEIGQEFDVTHERILQIEARSLQQLGAPEAGAAAIATYVYDAQGQLAAEYDTPTDSGTSYLAADHLGSTRLATDATGAVKKCYDYYLLGEDIASGTGGRSSCFAKRHLSEQPFPVGVGNSPNLKIAER